VISWDTDQQDLNTLDNVNGKTYQAVTSITSIQNQELVLLKGLERVVIPMSMAVRKDKLTAIEEVLKVFLQAADFLAGQLDNPQSFGSQFSARVGSMHISSHFLSRPKMVVMQGSKLARDQRSIMAASKLWENYHYIESFVTINDVNNQQVIFKEQEIPFCTADFVSLLDNNFCNTVDGEKAQVTNLVWRVEDDYATITYRVYRIYDNNLEINYLSV
jgi:predicted O-linked N-acetylglucosamine transferase (SPINDLY family)